MARDFDLGVFILFPFQGLVPRSLDESESVSDVRLHLSKQSHEKEMRQNIRNGESQPLRR